MLGGHSAVVYEYRCVAGDHIIGVSTVDGEVVDLGVLVAGGRAGYLDQVTVGGLQPLALPQVGRVDPPARGRVGASVSVNPEGVPGGGGECRCLAVGGTLDVNQRGGSVMIYVADGPAMVKQLAERKVFVDCRPGVGIRMSAHFFNTDEEVHEAMAILKELM